MLLENEVGPGFVIGCVFASGLVQVRRCVMMRESAEDFKKRWKMMLYNAHPRSRILAPLTSFCEKIILHLLTNILFHMISWQLSEKTLLLVVWSSKLSRTWAGAPKHVIMPSFQWTCLTKILLDYVNNFNTRKQVASYVVASIEHANNNSHTKCGEEIYWTDFTQAHIMDP